MHHNFWLSDLLAWQDWKRRGLHTMLVDEAKETNSEGVGIAEWTKFTKRLVKEQGPGFMNHFLTEMLQNHLPPLDGTHTDCSLLHLHFICRI